MSGDAELDAMIARLRALPVELGRAAAPACAAAIEPELARTIAAGTDSYGKAWAPKKSGDGKPLANADAAVGVAAIGSTVFVRVGGVEARHHLGRVKGKVARPIIPTAGIPNAWANVMRKAVSSVFLDVMAKRESPFVPMKLHGDVDTAAKRTAALAPHRAHLKAVSAEHKATPSKKTERRLKTAVSAMKKARSFVNITDYGLTKPFSQMTPGERAAHAWVESTGLGKFPKVPK